MPPADPAAAPPGGLRQVEAVMGTVFSFEIRPPLPAPALLRAVIAGLHGVDAEFSTYRPDSAISRLGRREIRLGECGPDVAAVLDLCAAVQRETGGYFTTRYAGGTDPTGLVKGWAVERASAQLTAGGAPRHSINGGGDVRVSGGGDEPWRIGIADPHHRGRVATVVTASAAAIATSGPYERGGHILDPYTGRPATDLASVTVVGPDLGRADGYATAAVAMGSAARRFLSRLHGYEGYVVDAAGEHWTTPGWPRRPAGRPPGRGLPVQETHSVLPAPGQ